jgi:ABC-2 type transport system ATP-binding protein
MKRIEFKKIVKKYPGSMALKGVSFEIRPGEIHALLGPNGAGKTTLMSILAGLIAPTSGQVLWHDEGGVSSTLPKMEGVKIGFCPDGPLLYDYLTVREQLHFVAAAHKLKPMIARMRVEQVIADFALDKFVHRVIKGLSRGQAQRVSLAQALLGDPEILILDEPTSTLDPEMCFEIHQHILRLKGHKTIILSTHQLHEAQKLADSLTLIKDGLVKKHGTLQDVLSSFKPHRTLEVVVKLAEAESSYQLLEESFRGEFKVRDLHISRLGSDQDCILKWEIQIDGQESRQQKEMLKFFYGQDISVLEFRSQKAQLEDLFLS